MVRKANERQFQYWDHGIAEAGKKELAGYLKGLVTCSDNLLQIVEGSTLNAHQQSNLSYIAGYLQAAQSLLQRMEVHERVQP